jgi:signal transduction histidine kinase
MSREYLQNIFTPFSQEETGYTRKFEGTGLGLALVKKYIEVNNAVIKVDSAKDAGTTFTLLFKKVVI